MTQNRSCQGSGETTTLWAETEKLLMICAKFFALTDAHLLALLADRPQKNSIEMSMMLSLIKTCTAAFIESIRESVRLYDLLEREND